MTTRRNALKIAAGAGMAVISVKPALAEAKQPITAEPFDVEKYDMMIAAMMVQVGVKPSTEAMGAVWDHFYGRAPLPAEYEPARQQCRAALLAVLKQLEG